MITHNCEIFESTLCSWLIIRRLNFERKGSIVKIAEKMKVVVNLNFYAFNRFVVAELKF